MGAPIGNQFWKLRSKHGRDSLFESPEMMEEAADEYFQWCIENPLIEIDFKGKDATKVEIPKMRAFTIQGLCRYLNCNVEYFRQFKEKLAYKEKGFARIVSYIEETIYEQKFTGSAAGFLNPNIIARDLGLVDKKDMSLHGDITVEYIEESDETVDQ
jgi:hypothetical protein